MLEDSAVYRRNVLYEAAKRPCHSAHDGLCPAEAARNAFAKWVRLEEIAGDTIPSSMRRHGVEKGGAPA